MDAVTKGQYELIFKLIYGLAHQPQPELPEGIDYNTAVRTVQDFAKQVLLADQLNKLPLPWDREKILTANLYLLKAFSQDQTPNVPRDLAEKLAEFQEFQANQAKVAAAQAAKKPEVHQQVQAALRQMAKNLELTAPESAQELEILQEVIAQELIQSPEQEVESLVAFVAATTPDASIEQLAVVLEPLIPPVIENSVVLNNFHTTVANTLANSVPENTAQQIATQALAYKLANPNLLPANLVELLTLKTESSFKVVFPDPKQLVDRLTAFNFSPRGQDLLVQTFVAQGMPVEVANLFTQKQMVDTNIWISSHIPASKEPQTPATRVKNQVSVLKDLHAISSRFLENGRFARYLEQVVSWQIIYQAYQVYQAENAVTPDQNIYSGPDSNPYLEFIVAQGKSYAQDYITGLALDAVVAGPIGAWVQADIKNVMVFDDLLATKTGQGAVAQVVKTTAGAATKTAASTAAEGTAATVTAGATAAVGGPPGWIIAGLLALKEVASYIGNKLKPYVKKLATFLASGILGGGIALAAGLGFVPVILAGLFSGLGGMLFAPTVSAAVSAQGGVAQSLAPVGHLAGHVLNSVVELAVVEIAIPVVIIIMSIPVVVALLLFIINSSAYVVPVGLNLAEAGSSPLLPPGASFDCKDAGNPILAPGAVLQLLPDSNAVRASHYCIVPTEIIIHWSGGWNGVQGTYNTLVTRDLACQYGTDENEVMQMQQMWEKKVEFPGCAYPHNDYSVNIEMSGTCFSSMPGGSCDGVNTPPPESEIQKTVDLVCWLKRQYNIQTIIGHFEIPNSGKVDPGKDFLYNTFLPRVSSQCP